MKDLALQKQETATTSAQRIELTWKEVRDKVVDKRRRYFKKYRRQERKMAVQGLRKV